MEMEEKKFLPFARFSTSLVKVSARRKVQPKHFPTLAKTYFQLVDRISSQTRKLDRNIPLLNPRRISVLEGEIKACKIAEFLGTKLSL